MIYRISTLALVILLLTPIALLAQSATTKLTQGIQAYNEVEWEKAAQLINEALQMGLSDVAKMEAYKYLGFCYFDMGEQVQAQRAFDNLLDLNLGYQLDPNAPQRYLRFFEIVKDGREGPLEEGIKAYNGNDFAQAIVRLQKALEEETSNPNRVLAHQYLAFCYVDTGQISKARSEFQKLLAIKPDYQPGNEVASRYSEICKEVKGGGVTPPRETGSIFVQSTPSAAQIMLDGDARGETPTTIRGVMTGIHSLKLTKNGYKDWDVRVNVDAGKTESVNAALLALSGPAPPPPNGGGSSLKWILGGGAVVAGGVVAFLITRPKDKGSLELTISLP